MNAQKRSARRLGEQTSAQTEVRNNPTVARYGLKPLPTTFRSGGFRFRQLERVGRVAVFEKRKGDLNVSFEAIRIRQVPETTMFGRIVPAHEAMPSSEQWGLYGWTYRDKAAAFRKFQALAQECPRLSTRRPKPTPIVAGTGKRGLKTVAEMAPWHVEGSAIATESKPLGKRRMTRDVSGAAA